MGSDSVIRRADEQECQHFNPRSPCGERLYLSVSVLSAAPFQSPLPVWGATAMVFLRRMPRGYFNPRSPCGERQAGQLTATAQYDFNPRSPCGERHRLFHCVAQSCEFQSTLPVWGATPPERVLLANAVISIHAPRVGSDTTAVEAHLWETISIHAPRVGSDILTAFPLTWWGYFNPRSPCGERPLVDALRYGEDAFQSTLPVWGATRKPSGKLLDIHHFNPRSPCGERR